MTEEVTVRVLDTRSKKQSTRGMVDRFRNWKEKLYAGWYVFRAQCKYWWLSQKKWQKAL